MIFHGLRKISIILIFLTTYFILLLLNAVGLNVWLPSCPIKSATGMECFGCGLNHAAIELLRGDFKEAAEHNWLIFIYVPAIIAVLGYYIVTKLSNHKNSSL